MSPGATATPRRAASTAANSPSANPACTSDAGAGGDLVDQPFRRRQLPAEPARRALGGQRHQTRSDDLHPRRQLLDRDDHGLERAGVAVRDRG